MSNTVSFRVTAGPMKGKAFDFAEHDTFLFGRAEECHCRLPDDGQVSRRHFIVEVNPPDARIKDFGSLNGTHVNGKKIGSRAKGETPEQGQQRKYPEVDLKDGDTLKAGQTEFAVKIVCAAGKGALLCSRCGKDVQAEVGGRRDGDYICLACRQSLQIDPAAALLEMLAKDDAKKAGATPKAKGEAPSVGGYRIGRRLGIGGFGAVYLAEREADGHPVAIKVMLSRVAVDEKARLQFAQEVKLLEKLRHGNIVSLISSGSAGGAFYFVMEYCAGGSLADYAAARGGKLSVKAALPILRQALEGLAYAHAQGVMHRDLKPANILLAGKPENPIAKISDLGFAKNFDKAGFSGMTVTGAYAGTPVFMPKEQLTNFKYVKPVTDVWSFGSTAYAVLTGRPPRDFPRGADPMEVILRGEIVPIRTRDPQVPAALAEVIDKAIRLNPKDRYQDAAEMLAELGKVNV